MKDRIIVIVQARMGSSRLPGKVMLPLLGKSLLARMIERLQKITYPISVVIATSRSGEDDAIVKEAQYLNTPCYRGNAENLLDRHYQTAKAHNAKYVLKIPSDCPLIDPFAVDRVLDYFFKPGNSYDYVSNLHPPTWPDGNDVEIMTMDCLERTWKNASRNLELEHTTPYIWENPHLFHIGNVQWETGLDLSMSHRFTIDYMADYHFIKRVFEELYPLNPDFSCMDIIRLLEEKPEICRLNNQYAGVNWYRNHLDELKTISPGHTRSLSTIE